MNLSKYIGRPYEEYNCFDLVKEFYMDQFGLDLKNYYEGPVPDRKTIQSLVVTNKGDFSLVEDPQFGDIVVLKLYGYSCHIGVCIGEGKFIHSIRKTGSSIEPLSRYKTLTEGFYRHREYVHD